MQLAEKKSLVAPSQFSKRAQSIELSLIKEQEAKAKKMTDCISLGIGSSDIAPPKFIFEEIFSGELEEPSSFSYTTSLGIPALREEIKTYYLQRFGTKDINPEKEILVTAGCMEALSIALSAVVDNGDEVLLPSPAYASHIQLIRYVGADPKFIPLNTEKGWQLDFDSLASAFTQRTKAVLLCSPHNPTGMVIPSETLRKVAESAIENDCYLILDAAYEEIIYSNHENFSLLNMPELRSRLIVASTFSKFFSLPGYRVGYTIAPQEIIERMVPIHDLFQHCATHMSQRIALRALQAFNRQEPAMARWQSEMLTELTSRRDLMYGYLQKLNNYFECDYLPDAAYYLFPRITFPHLSSKSIASRLLEEAKVNVTPGEAFGPQSKGHLRMCFSVDQQKIHSAFERIENWLKSNC